MPNGDHHMTKGDWEKIEVFFNNIASVLQKFADDFNLMIDKYYHHSKSWAFRFKHPKGGCAAVSLYYEGSERCYVQNAWYIDEYEAFTRFLKYGDKDHFIINDVNIYDVLKKGLREVIGWNKNDLEPKRGYKNPWAKYSKEEWLKLYSVDKYPDINFERLGAK